jgi:6-phospho-3-hexuloisomerase
MEESEECFVTRSMKRIQQNLQENLTHVGEHFEHTESFLQILEHVKREGKRIYLLASGRSGFILQCFQTRLIHLDYDVHFVTNLTTFPEMTDGDTLIVLSGSGTTAIVTSLVKIYVNSVRIGNLVVITSYPQTLLGRLGNPTIRLIGRVKSDDSFGDDAMLTPEGTAFEQVAFTYLDGVIAELARRLNRSNQDMLDSHSLVV